MSLRNLLAMSGPQAQSLSTATEKEWRYRKASGPCKARRGQQGLSPATATCQPLEFYVWTGNVPTGSNHFRRGKKGLKCIRCIKPAYFYLKKHKRCLTALFSSLHCSSGWWYIPVMFNAVILNDPCTFFHRKALQSLCPTKLPINVNGNIQEKKKTQ